MHPYFTEENGGLYGRNTQETNAGLKRKLCNNIIVLSLKFSMLRNVKIQIFFNFKLLVIIYFYINY